MIHALHGAVGHYSDWQENSISSMELNPVNLWQILQKKEVSLKQAAYQLNEGVTDPEAVLLGYSMGGRLALQALLLENSPWKKAIIVSASTGIEAKEEREKRVASDLLWSKKVLELEWQIFLQEWDAQRILQPVTKNEDSVLFTSRANREDHKVEISKAFKNWSTGAQNYLLPQLANINIPVLWITGAEDIKFHQIALSAKSHLPQMQHHSLKNCGHRVPWEKKREFSTLVDHFLTTSS